MTAARRRRDGRCGAFALKRLRSAGALRRLRASTRSCRRRSAERGLAICRARRSKASSASKSASSPCANVTGPSRSSIAMKLSTSSRVELAAGDPAQLGHRVLRRHRRAVGVARGQRVVGRADRDDARGERDLVADQPGRVAAAVDVLVVVEDRVGDRPVAVEAPDERRAVLRVAADHRPVLVGEDLGVEDAVGQRELADVVQQPGGVDEVLLGLAAADLLRQRARVARDRGGVARGRCGRAARASRRAWSARRAAARRGASSALPAGRRDPPSAAARPSGTGR